jgi:hypothetical protein
MHFFVHIGTHKTGSSLIQKVCLKNKEKLAANGISYPSDGFSKDGHHELAWALKRNDLEEGYKILNRIKNKEPENNLIILSSEDFEHLRNFESAKKLFEGHTLELCAYFRRQDDYLQSEYNQHVKMHRTRFSDDIFKFYMFHNFENRFNYKKIIEDWNKNLSVTDNHIFSFDRETKKNRLLHSFFESFYPSKFLKNLEIDEKMKSNVGIDPEMLIYLARLNKYANVTDKERQRFISILENEGHKSQKKFLDPTYAEKLVRNYNKGNRTLEANYMGGEKLFSNDFSVKETVDYYYDFDQSRFDLLIKKAGININK